MGRNAVRENLERAAHAALDKQALDVVLLDLNGLASFTSYFLLCTAQSTRQVQAIADEVDKQLGRAGTLATHSEGYENAEWVLLDYVDFVVHIFTPRARAYYDLERIWRRAARLKVPEQADADGRPHRK